MGQQEAHDTGSTWVQRIVVGPSFSQKCARESYAAGEDSVHELAQVHEQRCEKGTRHKRHMAGRDEEAIASERATAGISGKSPAITGHSRRCP